MNREMKKAFLNVVNTRACKLTGLKYQLSPKEAALYTAVTEYVRTEMNRVLRFADENNKKRNNVGFALQILQRRLASSPAAIYQSLKRRRERLENELAEARLVSKGRQGTFGEVEIGSEILRNIEEYGQEEVDEIEDLISTGATTAETIDQLMLEVETLKGLEKMALDVLRSGEDTKWTQLNRILDDDLMIDANGNRRKLIIFTEPKDTLHYLVDKIRSRIGNPDAVDVIHGGVTREERRKVIERFMQDKDMVVLIANDAAGEGVNLQRGHLMVNYDLPWNPNKIEQRFGRIHRIGQTEVCHLWNIRERDRQIGTGAPIQKKYERICFEKSGINQQPVATFVCPGHPLLEAVISIIREDNDHLMKQGAILVDETDDGQDLSAIFLLEHSIQDGWQTSMGKPHVISQKLQFTAINKEGRATNAGIAPHLNLRPATVDEISVVNDLLEEGWLRSDLEKTAVQFATVELAQGHVAEVRARRLPEIDKVEKEVKARLKKEINYWDRGYSLTACQTGD